VASNRTVTARQYVALYLYYVEGQSFRRIGATLGIKSSNGVYSLIQRGKRWIVEAEAEGVNASPFIEGRNASSTRNVGRAASRQDDLIAEVEWRVEQRERELADIDRLMRQNGGVDLEAELAHNRVFIHDYYDDAWCVPYRRPAHRLDQWEMRYLMAHPTSRTIHTAAYDSAKAAAHCAATYPTCGMDSPCHGCRTRPTD
jgi:hypothetical protein